MLRKFHVKINGKSYDVELEEFGVTGQAVVEQTTVAAAPAAPVATPAAPAGAGEAIVAPMPGTILDVKVAVGDQVKANQTLAILEAMKMENEIVAPRDGVITAVHVTKSSPIDVGQAIVSIQ